MWEHQFFCSDQGRVALCRFYLKQKEANELGGGKNKTRFIYFPLFNKYTNVLCHLKRVFFLFGIVFISYNIQSDLLLLVHMLRDGTTH